MEKGAHSQRFKAQINQIAQVAIDLFVKRGTTSLTILKAENRSSDTFNKPYSYWTKDLNVTFDFEKRTKKRPDLGIRLKKLRTKRGISQTEIAKLVGVTSSTISQIESNLIYPSIQTLIKIAEILSIEMSSFFQESEDISNRVVFPLNEATNIKFPDMPKGNIKTKLFIPLDLELKAEPYLIEIPPKQTLPSHFFIHKGQEVGYLVSGKLQLKFKKAVHNVNAGDVVYLTTEMPSQWENPGARPARLLWMKIK